MDKKIFNNNLNLMIVDGVFLILFGIVILFWPALTLSSVVILLGILAIVLGLTGIFRSFLSFTGWKSTTVLILGIIGTILGVFILSYPLISFIAYIYIVALWLILGGLFEIATSKQHMPDSRRWMIFYGILGILVGILLLIKPIISGVFLFWILGIYGIAAGIIQTLIALNSKSKVEKIKAGRSRFA